MPITIQLIVTGDMERFLPGLLARVFPATEVIFLPVEKTTAFTTCALSLWDDVEPLPPPDQLLAGSLATNLLAAIDPGSTGIPAHYAIAIDDVEVLNQSESGVRAIRSQMGTAVRSVIQHGGYPSSSMKTAQEPVVIGRGKPKHVERPFDTPKRRAFALKNRCSFHLLRPMLEGPLFADPAAIRAARPHPPMLPSAFDRNICDPEHFQIDTPAYLALPDGYLPPGNLRATVWAKANRRQHPKHYLEYLLDPTGTARRPFIEVEHGKAMMEAFDISTVFTHPGQMLFFQALICDIAHMANIAPPAGCSGMIPVPNLLRNL